MIAAQKGEHSRGTVKSPFAETTEIQLHPAALIHGLQAIAGQYFTASDGRGSD